jgi:hypothetical protein
MAQDVGNETVGGLMVCKVDRRSVDESESKRAILFCVDVD